MRVVEQAVADRIGDRWVAHVIVPFLRWQLTREDRRAIAIAIFDDLKKIAPLGVPHGNQAPVIQDQDVDPSQLGEEARVGSVGVDQGQLVEEPRYAPIECPVALAGKLVGLRHMRRTSCPRLWPP